VLVAIAPIAESADRSAAAGTPPVAAPAAERAQFGPIVGLAVQPRAAHRISRSGERVTALPHRAAVPVRRMARRVRPEVIGTHVAARLAHRTRPARFAHRAWSARSVHRVGSAMRTTVHRGVRFAGHRVQRGVPRRMAGVVAFALSQVGKRYVTGGEGGGGFDCSGLTKRAYAHAGLQLPHSSGAQAARARRISQSQALPGDLVVGTGHVGIYMGRGMMVDAGNHRVGVVYRHLYSGLHLARLN
jgi:cell wall-associated NlpC family hydrolase